MCTLSAKETFRNLIVNQPRTPTTAVVRSSTILSVTSLEADKMGPMSVRSSISESVSNFVEVRRKQERCNGANIPVLLDITSCRTPTRILCAFLHFVGWMCHSMTVVLKEIGRTPGCQKPDKRKKLSSPELPQLSSVAVFYIFLSKFFVFVYDSNPVSVSMHLYM